MGGGQEGIQCGWALGKQNSLRSHLTSPGLRDGPRGKARSIDRGCTQRLSLWTQLIQASCPSRVRRDHTVFIKILPHCLQALLLGLCVCDPGESESTDSLIRVREAIPFARHTTFILLSSLPPYHHRFCDSVAFTSFLPFLFSSVCVMVSILPCTRRAYLPRAHPPI